MHRCSPLRVLTRALPPTSPGRRCLRLFAASSLLSSNRRAAPSLASAPRRLPLRALALVAVASEAADQQHPLSCQRTAKSHCPRRPPWSCAPPPPRWAASSIVSAAVEVKAPSRAAFGSCLGLRAIACDRKLRHCRVRRLRGSRTRNRARRLSDCLSAASRLCCRRIVEPPRPRQSPRPVRRRSPLQASTRSSPPLSWRPVSSSLSVVVESPSRTAIGDSLSLCAIARARVPRHGRFCRLRGGLPAAPSELLSTRSRTDLGSSLCLRATARHLGQHRRRISRGLLGHPQSFRRITGSCRPQR